MDAFLTRHFGAKFAQMFGSALVHGIYAADSRILSIRAAFPILCQLERRGKSSIVRGAVADMMSFMPQSALSENEATEPYDLGEVPNLMKGVSVYSFREGMQTLTESMAKHLEARPNVDLLLGDGVRRLRKVDGYFEVSSPPKGWRLLTPPFSSSVHHRLREAYHLDSRRGRVAASATSLLA